MPYKNTQLAVESSEYYSAYQQRELERKRQEILDKKTNYRNNPNFAEEITRDQRGFILSFEDPIAFGKAAEQEGYELISIPLKVRLFISKYSKNLNTEFEVF